MFLYGDDARDRRRGDLLLRGPVRVLTYLFKLNFVLFYLLSCSAKVGCSANQAL